MPPRETKEALKYSSRLTRKFFVLIAISLMLVVVFFAVGDYLFRQKNKVISPAKDFGAVMEQKTLAYVMIGFKKDTGAERVGQIFSELGLNSQVEPFSLGTELSGWYKIKPPVDKPGELIKQIKKYPEVDFAEAVFNE